MPRFRPWDAGHEWSQLFWMLLPIVGWIILIVRLAKPSQTEAVPPTEAPAAPSPV